MGNQNERTVVGIDGDSFTINGNPTYSDTAFEGRSIEGLLLNSRMVQAIFDDENPDTRDRWAYPDTGKWDPERNVDEFLTALPAYYDHGLRAVTINLQCGNPDGYSPHHPQHVSAYRGDGSLKSDWLDRLDLVLDEADRLGMVIILGLFYQGQDTRLNDESAIINGVENVLDWLHEQDYRNVIIEVNNECDARPEQGWGYEQEILKPGRVHELIKLVRDYDAGEHSFLASTSFTGGTVPSDNVIAEADFALLHGNGVSDPRGIEEMVKRTRERPSYTEMPLVFNEDDHYDFRLYPNNMLIALQNRASWGYYDGGRNNYRDGYQSPPVDWSINTSRKKEFFDYVNYIVYESPG